MKKPALVWDAWNREHIKKHKVSIEEVEEVYSKSELTTQAKSGRLLVISKTKNGRLVTIFLSNEKQPAPFVVSARDSSKIERRIYYEKSKSL